jgi:hypothetical protein
MSNEIPKKIWMVWFQGADQAPSLVEETQASWKKLNPDWEFHFLDKEGLREHLDADWFLDHKNIPPQALSDIVRIMLLHKYGGVWVDASVFCTRPLDEWIYDHAPEGFFGYEKPRFDKLISSWFLVASKGNVVIKKWHDKTMKFWSVGPVAPKLISKVVQKCFHVLFKLKQAWIVKGLMWPMKRIGIFPYFWFHYLFDKLYARDDEVRAIWDRVPKLAADGPHTLIHYGLEQQPDERIREFIQVNGTSVHKLSWRTDINDPELAQSCIVKLIKTNHARYEY